MAESPLVTWVTSIWSNCFYRDHYGEAFIEMVMRTILELSKCLHSRQNWETSWRRWTGVFYFEILIWHLLASSHGEKKQRRQWNHRVERVLGPNGQVCVCINIQYIHMCFCYFKSYLSLQIIIIWWPGSSTGRHAMRGGYFLEIFLVSCLYSNEGFREQGLRNAFEAMDTDRDGFVTLTEFKQLMTKWISISHIFISFNA